MTPKVNKIDEILEFLRWRFEFEPFDSVIVPKVYLLKNMGRVSDYKNKMTSGLPVQDYALSLSSNKYRHSPDY